MLPDAQYLFKKFKTSENIKQISYIFKLLWKFSLIFIPFHLKEVQMSEKNEIVNMKYLNKFKAI